MALVCPQCQHVVVRTDRDLVNMGKVADVVFNDTALAHGDGGVFQGRSFLVHGRVVMQHPAGGTWEEYYAIFDGTGPSWIEEAMGRWYVLQQVEATPPAIEGLAPGVSVDLGPYGTFVVDEVSQGTFASAEGELPFSAAPGTVRRFADLSAADGSRASIQQVEGSSAVDVFVGVETTFDALGVHRRSGERAEHKIAIGEIKCPSCGAPLPARKDPKAERFVCKYCGALADVATHTVIAQQDVSRLTPAIPLGSQGALDATPWVVIGYVTRATNIEEETFTWEEYLLYNADRGYAWLICDEGIWRLGFALAGGEVDAARFPESVKHHDTRYGFRNSGHASVTHVLGEFYWQVTLGETVLAHDFEAGSTVISREASGSEVNWTLARTIPSALIDSAFGVNVGAVHASTPLDPTPDGASESFFSGSRIAPYLLLALAFFFVVKVGKACQSAGPGQSVAQDCDDDGNCSPSGRGAGGAGGSGGFGGK